MATRNGLAYTTYIYRCRTWCGQLQQQQHQQQWRGSGPKNGQQTEAVNKTMQHFSVSAGAVQLEVKWRKTVGHPFVDSAELVFCSLSVTWIEMYYGWPPTTGRFESAHQTECRRFDVNATRHNAIELFAYCTGHTAHIDRTNFFLLFLLFFLSSWANIALSGRRTDFFCLYFTFVVPEIVVESCFCLFCCCCDGHDSHVLQNIDVTQCNRHCTLFAFHISGFWNGSNFSVVERASPLDDRPSVSTGKYIFNIWLHAFSFCHFFEIQIVLVFSSRSIRNRFLARNAWFYVLNSVSRDCQWCKQKLQYDDGVQVISSETSNCYFNCPLVSSDAQCIRVDCEWLAILSNVGRAAILYFFFSIIPSSCHIFFL